MEKKSFTMLLAITQVLGIYLTAYFKIPPVISITTSLNLQLSIDILQEALEKAK